MRHQTNKNSIIKTEKIKIGKLAFVIIGFLAISLTATSCKKDNGTPGNNGSTGVHNVDPKLVGRWMWTQGSDAASYDDNGVYTGAAYGLAQEYSINADGSGTCFNHVQSTLGVGSSIVVDISYKGFFESDNQGHLGFFPTSGTYKSSSGENRALRSDELYNVSAKTGKTFLYQKLIITTQGQRQCFQVTSYDNITDTFFQVN